MLEKYGRKIDPLWVQRFDQCVFLVAAPALNFFFASDRIARVVEILVVNKPIRLVRLCKASDFRILMLPHPTHEVVSDAGVQNDAAAIGHHVNVERFRHLVRSFASLRMTRLEG